MNYTVKGRIYTADEGYVFLLKGTEHTTKRMALPKPEMIANFDIIPEPVPEEPEIPEVPETEEQATEEDYINALKELGVNFNE